MEKQRKKLMILNLTLICVDLFPSDGTTCVLICSTKPKIEYDNQNMQGLPVCRSDLRWYKLHRMMSRTKPNIDSITCVASCPSMKSKANAQQSL